MKLSKKPPLLLTVGAAILLLAGGAIAFWGLSRRNQMAESLLSGAGLIPEDAVMAVSLTTDEGQWRRLRQYGTPETQAQFDQFLAQWRDRIFLQNDLSFRTDIQPWVGSEITVAFLPTAEADSGIEPPAIPLPEDAANVLAILPIADLARAQDTLGSQITDAATPPQDYRGVAIHQIATDGEGSFYGALVGTGWIVVSTQLATVEKAIDAHKGGASLAALPGFSRAFEEVSQPSPFAELYLNVPAAAQTLSDTSQPSLPTRQLEALKTERGLAGAILLESRGIQVQSVSWLSPETSQVFATENGANLMPQQFPTNTLMMVSGGNFQQFWQDYQAEENLGGLMPFNPDNLAVSLQAATGLTLEEDLLPWMDGEFAIGLLSPPQPEQPEAADPPTPTPAQLPNPALAIMVKVSDREAAEATLKQLNEVVTTRYRFTVEAVESGGVPVTQWVSPFEALTISYGWNEGDVLFMTLGESVAEAVAPTPARALANNNLFQTTTGQAPRPNNGHFFLNLSAMADAQNSLLLPPLPEDGLIGSEAIEAIGVTATALGERQVRYDLFAALKRGNRPGDLPDYTPEAPAEPETEAAPETSPEDAPAEPSATDEP